MTIKCREGSDNWYYRFSFKCEDYCEGGFPTKGQALEAERLKRNRLIEKQLHPTDHTQQSTDTMTFRIAGEWWLKEHAPTKRSKKVDFSRMPIAIQFFGDKLLSKITPEEVDTFLRKLSELCGERIGDHTRNHYRALVHALYELLIFKRKYRGENPVKFVAKIDVPQSRVRFIYPTEEKILTRAMLQDADLYDYYMFGVELGLRIDEMRHILVKHVDMVMNNIFVGAVSHLAKNNKSRYVRFDTPWDPNHSIVRLLERRIAAKGPEEYLLPHWGYTYIAGHFKGICEAVGIKLEKGEAFHVLRHSFAFHRLSHGQPLYIVSKLMGHSSQSVTEKHYGHLDLSAMGDAKMTPMPFLSCNRIATEVVEKREIEAQI